MENPGLSSLVMARAEALGYYSPYCFLRQLAQERQQELFGAGAAARWGQGPGETTLRARFPEASAEVHWLLRQLAWDSAYFGTPTYRLFTGLFAAHTTVAELVRAEIGRAHV